MEINYSLKLKKISFQDLPVNTMFIYGYENCEVSDAFVYIKLNNDTNNNCLKIQGGNSVTYANFSLTTLWYFYSVTFKEADAQPIS